MQPNLDHLYIGHLGTFSLVLGINMNLSSSFSMVPRAYTVLCRSVV